MKILTVLDMLKNQIKNLVIDNESSAPSNPVAGQLYFDTTDNKMKVYNGTTWVAAEGSDISGKMDKTDPTGTGSFSLNRAANTTVGLYSVAEGYTTTASEAASHAEGVGTTASGGGSHAEGSSSHAEGYNSHAEGSSSHAEGFASHAEGLETTASGSGSHAEGSSTAASGEYSHAEGAHTTALGNCQHVQGLYNVIDRAGANAVYADIIGNGASSDARKNIEATTFTGDKRMKGDVYVGCNDDSTGGTKLAKVTEIYAPINRSNAVNVANTDYTTYMARGEALNTSDTTPSVNGAISWTYS